MYLYQHLTECYVAVQLLLNRSAHYWSFIPMSMEEAEQEEKKDLQNTKVDSQYGSPYERTDQEVEWCLANLPRTPPNTRFSRVQINKQTEFLKSGSDLLFLPVRHLDIFNMAIVFVRMFLKKKSSMFFFFFFFFFISTRRLFTIIMSND
jgi:hypothetical protein